MSRATLFLLVVLLGVFGSSSLAAAEFDFALGTTHLEVLDSKGQPDNRAGAHPDHLIVEFAFNEKNEVPEGNPKDLLVELPPGLIGDPTSVPACSRRIFDGGIYHGDECPEESQIGIFKLRLSGIGEVELPLFNVEPAPDQYALFGASLIGKFPLEVELRPNDFGVTIRADGLVQDFPLLGGSFELWGVPADHQNETETPRRALLTTPTECDGPLRLTLRARSWEQPERWVSTQAVSGGALEDCAGLDFQPSATLTLSDPLADAPTGASIELTLPQSIDPDGRISAGLRDADISLPEGISISPPSTDGLQLCSDAELARGSDEKARCPDASTVGAFELQSPFLGQPLRGRIYAGQEHPGDRFRMFLVAKGRGIEFKLIGSLDPDSETGRLEVHLADLPQIPFTQIRFSFEGGPHSLLATPTGCGLIIGEASFRSYAGDEAVASIAPTSIGPRFDGARCPGPAPFQPSFTAGSSSAVAGRHTAFATTLERRDGEQSFGRLSVTFPPGLVAVLRAAHRCGEAEAAAAACPAASRVGAAVAELGPGTALVALHGDAYLTGPFRRDPFGLALIFHSALGPFDVGSLVVRAGLAMDPSTGQMTIRTEALPQIQAGIPLRMRAIAIDIDRPGFMLNPTSCALSSVEAVVRSANGTVADASSPFLLRSCNLLHFRPTISMALVDGPSLKLRHKPGLWMKLRTKAQGANLRSVRMALRAGLRFDVSELDELCARTQVAEGRCPAGARVGSAFARTPLLNPPLKGSIYVVQPSGSGLPDLWVSLRGEGLRFDIKGETFNRKGRLETKFNRVPDVPFSTLSLRFAGGGDGILALKRSLCDNGRRRPPTATIAVEGQNGAYRAKRLSLSVRDCIRARTTAQSGSNAQRQRRG